jgi:hypothetical protein
MRKILITFILVTFAIMLLANEFSFSGTNQFKYIYRDRRVEYRSYFSEKLALQMHYKMLNVGLKRIVYYPYHDKFLDIDNITNEDEIPALLDDNEKNEYYFEEYYLQFENDFLFANVGTYETVIGSGIVAHNYYDEDFEEDSRLMGIYLQSYFSRFNIQTFYSSMENEDDEEKDDIIGAFDLETEITDNIKIGASYLMDMINQENQNTETDFSQRDVIAGRFNFQHDKLDVSVEYAESNEYDHYDDNKIDGSAFYSNFSAYLGKFTLVGAYKKYEKFDVRISDLPTANHSEEPLDDSWEPGIDEEGMMGEVQFIPNYENEFILNYAEGWSSDFKVRQSDLFTEYRHDFEEVSFKAEYSQLEQMNKIISNWKKEITPVLSADFMIGQFPMLIKAEYQYKEKEQGTETKSHYEPKLQTDISYSGYFLSVIVENQIGDSEDGEDGELWIGAEFAATIFGSTDLRIFGGKEKGGKVCRNGVCRYQAEFEGIRVETTTNF